MTTPMQYTLTIQPNATAGKDVSLRQDQPDTNFGTVNIIGVGESNASTVWKRALIAFDLSSIPSNATIVSATLSLTVVTDSSSNARTMSAYRVKRNWTETGATWNKYDGTNDWQTAGAGGANDIDVSAMGSGSVTASQAVGSVVTLTFTAAEVQKFIDGTYTNYGWLLMVDTESSDLYDYASSDHSTATLRPVLTVVYSVLSCQKAQNRWKKYYLAISHPTTIFTALINGAPDTNDGVIQLTYDNGTGTYGDVKPGMSCWVSATAFGAWDAGVVRVRDSLTATTVPIGITSGVNFGDNYYLTFVDDFNLWAREPYITDVETKIDSVVAFEPNKACAPIVRIGPPALVLDTTAATVAHTRPAPTIYSPSGQTASAYAWTAPGGTIDSATIAAPTITYDASSAGEYYESLTITDSAGATSTVYRKVFINPPSATFDVREISGDIDSGYWEAKIEGYDGVDLTELHDRALCVLWRRDYRGTALDNQFGPYTEGKNIRLIGWIDRESISINPNFGTFSFSIFGPAYWLDKIPGGPMTITDTSNPIASWNEIATMDTDRALYRLIKHQSTLADITDVMLSGDDTRIHLANVNTGSLKQQIDGLANEKLIARLGGDRFGCIYISIPQSLQDATGKAALPVLWNSAAGDWSDRLEIERVTTPEASMVEIGGLAWDGTTEIEIYSRAPGNVNTLHGSPQAPYTTLVVDSQSIMNRISGDVLALENSEYPDVNMLLWWANDYIDIAPAYIVTIDQASTDSPRGITWTNKRFIPQAVSYNYDAETGAESTEISFAEETTGRDGMTYYPPQPPDTDVVVIPPTTFPPFVPPTTTWFPPAITDPPVTDGCGTGAVSNNYPLVFSPTTITGTDTIRSSYAYYPCKLRAAASSYPTYLQIPITYYGDASGNISAYAIDAGKNRIATLTVSPLVGATKLAYTGVGELDCAGFEIELAAGGSIDYFEFGIQIGSGSVLATNASGTVVTGMTNGNYYAITGTGGPWNNGLVGTMYTYDINGNGTVGYSGQSRAFILTTPASCAYAQQISSLYGRVYLLKGVGDITFRCADTVFSDNSGSLGYLLNAAEAFGTRRIFIHDARIFNVCTAG